jgi:CBS domain-containing protein
VVSGEYIARFDALSGDSEFPGPLPASEPAVLTAADGANLPDAQDILREFPEARALVARLAAEDLPAPTEAEFCDERGAIVLPTVLAWEDLRIGLVAGLTERDVQDAQRHGIRAFDLDTLDRDLEDVLAAVRAGTEGTP